MVWCLFAVGGWSSFASFFYSSSSGPALIGWVPALFTFLLPLFRKVGMGWEFLFTTRRVSLKHEDGIGWNRMEWGGIGWMD